MPYDPEKPDEFRQALNRLMHTEHCTAEEIIALAYGRSRPAPISVATFNRFILGKGGHTKVSELRTIARELEKHAVYRHYFENVHSASTPVISESLTDPFDAFVFGMTSLFSEGGRINASFPLDGPARFGERLVGEYALYRPSWRPYVDDKRYTKETMVSRLSISKSPYGYVITDTQDFQQEGSLQRFTQTDRGCLVAVGYYLYFLTKEQTGTTVRLGLIENLLDLDPSIPIDHFRGVWYSSSHLAVYAPLKFFCRRVADASAVKSGPVDLKQINDTVVRAYLQNPLPAALQFVAKPSRRPK
jgi:hypothetical protein